MCGVKWPLQITFFNKQFDIRSTKVHAKISFEAWTTYLNYLLFFTDLHLTWIIFTLQRLVEFLEELRWTSDLHLTGHRELSSSFL